jgi:hypothetical protein
MKGHSKAHVINKSLVASVAMRFSWVWVSNHEKGEKYM